MARTHFIAFLIAAGISCSFADGSSADTLVEYQIESFMIVESLTRRSGDPANGKKVVMDLKRGNCLACHVMPIPEQPFHGDVGPPLIGIANKYNEGQLRLRVVNAKVFNSLSVMPPFYKAEGFNRVLKEFQGKTILTAQEVEDVVAYLMTLQ